MPWSLRLGGHTRVQNIEDRGEQRAGGVRWKHLLIWLILKLHHIICVIWSWIFKSESETLWNTIWLPSKLLTPHHTYPPASRSFFCLFCEWNTKYFLSAAGNLFRAPQHHTGGLEKPLLIVKALPEQAIIPDSPAQHRPRSHHAAAFGTLKEWEEFGK